MKSRNNFFKTVFLVSLFIVIGGFLAAFIVSDRVDKKEREILQVRADNASLVFTSEEIKNLTGTEEDINNAYYFDIKNKLTYLRKANPDARFVYLMGSNGQQLFFFADSESITSGDYSPPGQIYEDADQEDLDNYFNGISYTEGPYTDSWGDWVSGYSHIKDPVTGEVVAMLGMDIDAKSWESGIITWKFLIAGITLLLCAYFTLLLRAIWKNEEKTSTLTSDHGEVLNWRDKIKDFQSFAKVSVFKINPRDMKIIAEDGFDASLNGKVLSDVDSMISESLKSNILLGKEDISLTSETGGVKRFWKFEIRYDAGMNPVSIKSARIDIS